MKQFTVSPLRFRISWIRNARPIDWTFPSFWMPIGPNGVGKSAFLGMLATQYFEHGCVLDILSSWSNENLAWTRTDADLLFVTGENVDLTGDLGSWNQVKMNSLSLSDFKPRRVIIATPYFFSPFLDYYSVVNRVCWGLLPMKTPTKYPDYLLMREIAAVVYARLQVDKDIEVSKGKVAEFIRQRRQVGVACGMDSIRSMGADIEIRAPIDYLIPKALGIEGLPRDLRWVYHYFDPTLVGNLRASQFVLIGRRRELGFGSFEKPPWHKERDENILAELKFSRDVGTPMPKPIERDYSRMVKVTPEMHNEIIRLSQEGGETQLAMGVKFGVGERTVRGEVALHKLKNCYCYGVKKGGGSVRENRDNDIVDSIISKLKDQGYETTA